METKYSLTSNPDVNFSLVFENDKYYIAHKINGAEFKYEITKGEYHSIILDYESFGFGEYFIKSIILNHIKIIDHITFETIIGREEISTFIEVIYNDPNISDKITTI